MADEIKTCPECNRLLSLQEGVGKLREEIAMLLVGADADAQVIGELKAEIARLTTGSNWSPGSGKYGRP